MKQELLQQYIDKLESDVNFAITVEDISHDDNIFAIVPNATNKVLTADYGSAANFFESIYKSGSRKIRIIGQKRNGKNGSRVNWKRATTIQPLDITLSDKQANTTLVKTNAIPGYPGYTPPAFHGGATNGLSGAENYRVHDYDRINTDLIRANAKNETLTDRVKELEQECFKHDVLGTKSVEKSEAQAKILEKVGVFMPAIEKIVDRVMNGNTVQAASIGLGQPMSAIRQQFMAQEDSLLNDLLPIANALNNPDFDAELQALLAKYNFVA